MILFLSEGLLPEGKCARTCPVFSPPFPPVDLGLIDNWFRCPHLKQTQVQWWGYRSILHQVVFFSVIKVMWKLAKKLLSLSEVTFAALWKYVAE